MSVRVCYMKRESRGAGLSSLRLVGQASDESWPDVDGNGASGGNAAGAAITVAGGAAWIRQRLQATRTARSLTALILDSSAGVCAWVSSPSREAGVVAAIARTGAAVAATDGGAGEASVRAGAALEYFAPSDPESSIEPLSPPVPGSGATRLAVLGVSDVSARLLIDALDAEGVPVEQTSTIWHAICAAWDPAARSARSGRESENEVVAAAALCGIVLVDPAGTLLWAWSREGRLVAGGSLRLRMASVASVDSEQASEAEEPRVLLGSDEASRLTAEWLSWSVQMSAAPSRVVCLTPEGVAAGEFGRDLTRLWPGASVDVAVQTDAIGLTLRRFADRLESQATPDGASEDAGSMLMGLSQRPGRATRRAHLWIAGAVAGLAGLGFVASWKLSSAAAERRATAAAWETQWRDTISEVFPDALRPVPRVSPQQLLADEIRRKERELLPVEQPEKTMPVMQELETISMVVGNGIFGLDRISLDTRRIEVVTIARTTKDAEDLLEALRRIGGSHAVEWTMRLRDRRDGTETLIEGRYEAQWNPDLRKGTAGGGGTPAVGGGA